MVHELNMIQHVRYHTRFYNILDLYLSPDDDSILNVEVKGDFYTSGHFYFTVDINIPVRVASLTRTYRDFNDGEYELLNAHLTIIDWDSHFNATIMIVTCYIQSFSLLLMF